MNVLIVGCGRIGSHLATALAREGHAVTIIDRDARAFQRRLDPEFPGERVVGNAMDTDVLERAGIKDAEVLVTLTDGDNRNIMIAQIAQVKFQVPRVLARIADPLRAEAYRDMGIGTVAQTNIMTEAMRRVVLNLGAAEPETPETPHE